MQSTLRTKIAATALVLAPLGALVAAQPASAELVHGAIPGQAVIRTDVEGGWQDHGHRDVRDVRDSRDHRAPSISEVTPQQGARLFNRGETRISARFSDDGSGIDPRGVTLRVDGRDVTRQARIEGNAVRYADDLRPGRHSAELLVRDRAGNVARQAWNFDVAGRGRGNDARNDARDEDRGQDHGHEHDHDGRW
jgi:hypothetical protein